MNILPNISSDFIGSMVGFILTLMIFSYLLGDNGLFRLAVHILVGVSAGFVGVVAWYNVIWPQLIYPLWDGTGTNRALLIVPLVMSLLLFAKAFPRFSKLGSPVMAYLVGVGAASAMGGAIMGTLIPQVQSTINQVDWRSAGSGLSSSSLLIVNGLIFLVGAISTLAYFQFTARSQGKVLTERSPLIEWLAQLGQFFITVALGVLFAGVFLSALAAFVERWQFIYFFVKSWFGN